ncbi:MAG: SAM-dependent methyltransferase [Pseudomonadota bacterium]
MADQPPYDPDARRETPLLAFLRARIASDGPMCVSAYMRHCLQHPEHGYYRGKPAIGRAGDFVTAPEISQVFGEIIGLWCAVVWQSMGSPARFNLVELGPGRGTLMADAVRAARIVPGFLEAAHLSLIETNETLKTEQAARLKDVSSTINLQWCEAIEDLLEAAPDAYRTPTLFIGNEFLDVLPVAQFSLADGGWYRRRVGIDDRGALAFTGPRAVADGPPQPLAMPELDTWAGDRTGGAIATVCQYGIVDEVLAPWEQMAALFIDYGHTTQTLGDTLQAVRGHAYEHPLTSPGEADLTAQVDFAAFAKHARSMSLAVDGPLTQAAFLGALGAPERASQLMSANPGRAADIEAGVLRLLAPTGMGARFKAIGVRSPSLPLLPGFPAA